MVKSTLHVVITVGALLGGIEACSHTDLDVPNAGPVLAADTQRIYESQAFIAFANEAHLSPTQGILVARTLALYGENDASARETAKTPQDLASVHAQLLRDTVVQIRIEMPASAWDGFTQSGLLSEATTASNH